MSNTSRLEVVGLDKLMKKVARIADPAKAFDDTIADRALEFQNEAIEETPQSIMSSTKWGYKRRPLTQRVTGRSSYEDKRVRDSWVPPRKLADSVYATGNTATSRDGKYSIARILSEGRGPVTPRKPGGVLYIPLNAKGRKKAPVAKPTGLKYGTDYVYIKRARAFKGTGYLEKIEHEHQKLMIGDVIRRAEEIFKGNR